jgi:hypothetical protein
MLVKILRVLALRAALVVVVVALAVPIRVIVAKQKNS